MKSRKKCKKCNKIKTLNKFSFYSPGKYRNICKKCISIYDKMLRIDNPKKYKIATKLWQLKNPERVRYHNEQYYLKNNKEIKLYKKQYRLDNPDKVKAYQRKYRANKLKVNENYTSYDEAITLFVFGIECFKCGSNKKLSIDHHHPLSKGNPLTITNAVPLCGSCNSFKKTKNPNTFYTKNELQQIDVLFKFANKIKQ